MNGRRHTENDTDAMHANASGRLNNDMHFVQSSVYCEAVQQQAGHNAPPDIHNLDPVHFTWAVQKLYKPQLAA